jgi:elongation factor P
MSLVNLASHLKIKLQVKHNAILLREKMKINGNEIRPGYIIEHNGRLWSAVKTEHVKPGKGGAYMQVELRDIRSGTKSNERFRASESVERVRLEEREFQFLYEESSELLAFMDQENFEQISVKKDILGDSGAFLQEGMSVMVSIHEGEVMSIRLPDTVIMKIIEADPVVKGQTATGSYKPAILENGVRVMVPPHIESGVRVVVNTVDSTYIERAKE